MMIGSLVMKCGPLQWRWPEERERLHKKATSNIFELPFYSGYTMKWYGKSPLKPVWPAQKKVYWPLFTVGVILAGILCVIWMAIKIHLS
jgi:hypothetical protein